MMDKNPKETPNSTPKEQPNSKTKSQTQPRPTYASPMPEQVHCKHCKTLMENGVCPSCGFKIYTPMDAKKREKIKLITTIIGFAIFFVIFIFLQAKKG